MKLNNCEGKTKFDSHDSKPGRVFLDLTSGQNACGLNSQLHWPTVKSLQASEYNILNVFNKYNQSISSFSKSMDSFFQKNENREFPIFWEICHSKSQIEWKKCQITLLFSAYFVKNCFFYHSGNFQVITNFEKRVMVI